MYIMIIIKIVILLLNVYYMINVLYLQSAEKSLKALLIYHNINNSSMQSHDLIKLVRQIRHHDLNKHARQLQGIVGFVGRTRYPDSVSLSKIPHDMYSKSDALVAIEIAVNIVNTIDQMLS